MRQADGVRGSVTATAPPTHISRAHAEVEHVTHGLLRLALGGTAVGTALNAPG